MERIRLMAGLAFVVQATKPPASSKFGSLFCNIGAGAEIFSRWVLAVLGTKYTCPVKICDGSNVDRRRNCQRNLDASPTANPPSSTYSTMPATHTIKATDLPVHGVTVFQADRAEVNRLVPVELKVGHTFTFHSLSKALLHRNIGRDKRGRDCPATHSPRPGQHSSGRHWERHYCGRYLPPTEIERFG